MKVYLVGAGPGDPGLITVKGRRILERADAVLYDNLASERLLDHAPARAERIYVGKKRAEHEMSQEEISALLIERARRGWTVVRLKGGDPFIFARGGEEIEALAAAGIPFEIVPGVTTPLGLAAYTGVPLTHREHTSAVTFVTGHNVAAIDWGKIGSAETVVLFMGLVNFAAIAREMIARGRSAKTPAMVVRWATRPDQQTMVGTLETLPDQIAKSGLKPPATIVIGEVVALRDRFNWFERLPLFGQRIVVTRDARQAAELAEPLEELGAEVLLLPVIEIRPPADPGPLDRAIARLDTYDWLIFTSVNGVRSFVAHLPDIRSLRAKICAHRSGDAGCRRSAAYKGRPHAEGIRRRKSARSVVAGRSGRQASAAAARRGRSRSCTSRACAQRRAGRCRGGVSHGNPGRRSRTGARMCSRESRTGSCSPVRRR